MRSMGLPAVSIVVALVACKGSEQRSAPPTGSGSAPAPQTAKQAMEIVCDAEASAGPVASGSAERGPAIIASLRGRVTNPDIRRVLDELALDTWPSARSRLVALAAQHGASPCKLAESAAAAPPLIPVAVPEVSGPTQPDAGGPLLVVTPTHVSLDDTAIVALDAGHVAPAEIERRAIKKLAAQIAKAPPLGRMRIAFDRTIPVETALAVIRSFANDGTAEIALVCTQNHENVLVPVDMPLRDSDAWFVVTASKDALTLAPWNGGKPGAPTVTATLDGGLGQILRGLATELAKGTGIAPTIPVMLVVDPSHDVNRLVGLLGGLRTMSSRVVLSPGTK